MLQRAWEASLKFEKDESPRPDPLSRCIGSAALADAPKAKSKAKRPVNEDLRSVLECEGKVWLRCLWWGFSPCLPVSCLRDLGLLRESDFEDRVRFLLAAIFASCLCLRVGGVSRGSLSTPRD